MAKVENIRRYTTPLANTLQLVYAGNSTRKQLLSKYWFKKSFEGCTVRFPHNYQSFGLESPYERMDTYKALLQSVEESVAESTLVQEEIFKSIINGGWPLRCWRECLISQPTTSNYRVRAVKGSTGYYANEVAEAGMISVQDEQFSYVNIQMSKIGSTIQITNELVDDCQFNIIENLVEKGGMAIENKLNRNILNAILNGSNAVSTNTLNPAGAHLAVSDLALAVSKCQKQSFFADTVVLYPTSAGYLMQDSNISYVSFMGSDSPLKTGKVPILMGLTPYTCTATDKATSPTWGDTTAGTSVGAVVFSKKDLGYLFISRDITIKEAENVLHDLQNIPITMIFGFDVLNEKSACIVYHK